MMLGGPVSAFAGESAPDGWRYPGEPDFNGPWLDFRDKIPNPFHVKADFNGDGEDDDAWIMIRVDNSGWGLFVFMGDNDGQVRIIKLMDEPGRSYSSFGIELVQPGAYETACGKGYWDCAPGESAVIVLKRPGINFFKYESANSFYFWDDEEEEFKSVSISD